MKKLFSILLVLFPLACQHSPSDETRVVHNLVEDFRYARQASAGSRKLSIFSTGSVYVRNKKFPALVQHSSGQISFFVKFANRPVLKLRPQVSGKLRDAPHPIVRVRSDFPSFLERSFPVQWNQSFHIDLHEFQGRTAAIQFSAEADRKKFKNPVYWINPSTEQIAPENKRPSQDGIRDFQQRHKKDNLLIVVFDAATASHFGCYGYPKQTTPIVDSFAAESVLWENAFTQAVYTIASTGTLFTGQYPNVHGVIGNGMALNKKYKTMAEAMREAGFQTALFTANANASPMAGYGQGFDHIWMPKDTFIRANDFVEPVIQWIDANRNRRFFGYVHFREPHYPFSAPTEYLEQFDTDLQFQLPITDNKLHRSDEERRKITAAYDANLAFVDREFGRIIHHLRKTGELEETIVMLLSDHGEAFWEHRLQGHNYSLYDEVMRVPLIARFPREKRLSGIRRNRPVGTLQIFPTVAELFQLSRRALRWPSRDLMPVILDDQGNAEEFVFSQAAEQKAYTIRSAEYKYIGFSKKEYDEMYVLQKDPEERKNRIRDYPILAEYFRLTLEKKLKHMKLSAGKLLTPESVIIDKESEEQLRTLGYIQ